jgi:exodeoxyribonuclease V gamma subunit
MGTMLGDENRISLGIAPYSEIEGSDLQILGRFISFFNSIRDIYYMLKNNYTLNEWSDVINIILDSLFAAEKISSTLKTIYTLSLKLKDIHEELTSNEKINLRVICEFFEDSLSNESTGGDFASGSLIFCEMLPMRSIPKKVICIIGMNDFVFPRKSGVVSFNIISTHPKRGDRSIRDEDRFLFLETLISARENLYISYIGRDMNNGTELNPSIVVSELIDYIKSYYKVDEGKSIIDYISKTHRIQSYNPVYFIPESGFFTYQGSKLDGAKSYARTKKTDFTFMKESLPPLTDDEKNISVNDLAAFLVNPSEWVIKKRLGLSLTLRSDEYIEEELFKLDGLDLYRLNSGIMKALIRGDDKEDFFRFVKASGVLPHGNSGIVTYNSSFSQVKKFYDKFSHLLHNKSPDREITISINDITISGVVDNIYDGRCIFFRYASETSLDILTSWITHLLLLSSGNFFGNTILLSKNGGKVWGEINNSREILSKLLDIYREGVRKPIPLFPRSSLQYAETFYSTKKGEPGAEALKKARESFDNKNFTHDSDNPYVKLFFGESYILAGTFIDITMKVYSPIFENFESAEIE